MTILIILAALAALVLFYFIFKPKPVTTTTTTLPSSTTTTTLEPIVPTTTTTTTPEPIPEPTTTTTSTTVFDPNSRNLYWMMSSLIEEKDSLWIAVNDKVYVSTTAFNNHGDFVVNVGDSIYVSIGNDSGADNGLYNNIYVYSENPNFDIYNSEYQKHSTDYTFIVTSEMGDVNITASFDYPS